MKAAKLYILLLLGWQTVLAQVFPTLKFSHLTTKEGLSNNHVKWITQDKEGFIWIGTEDGLNRLDGYRVKNFYHHPSDSNSLVNNEINEIGSDDKGNLWITTLEGISNYNTAKHIFTNFLYKEGNTAGLRSGWATAIFLERKNSLAWISTNKSLYRFDEQLKYKEWPVDKSNLPAGFPDLPIDYFGMYEDRQHQLWAYLQNWIFKLDPLTKQILQSFHTTNNSHVRSLFQDISGNYWVGTFGGGLSNFNPENNTFKKIALSNNPSFIFSICDWKDKKNNNWIALGSEKGLLLMDPLTLMNKLFSTETLNDYSIAGGDVLNLFVDRQNILWIGTEKGVSYIDPSKQLIEAWDIGSISDKIKGYQPGFSYSFFEDEDSYQASNWVKPGLFYFNKYGLQLQVVANLYPANPASLKSKTDRAFDIIKQNDGTFWYLTEMGLIHFDPSKNKSNLYKPTDGDEAPGFRTLLKYNDSTWWIRTRNNGPNGIYIFNAIQKKFTHHYYYQPGCVNCLPPYLHDLVITKNKNIYASPSDNYLYKFDRQQNNFIPLFTSKEQMLPLPSKTFECMAEDSSGNLWIGTGNGLFALDPADKKIVKDYSNDKKLGGIAISKVCFDDDQNLWMTTERGLYCLTHGTQEIFNFNTGDGLPNNSLPGFLTKGKNGAMYAGALGYIIKFKPSELLQQHAFGEVEFSEVTVMNEPRAVKQNENNEKKIKVGAGENIFSVDYSVLNYDNASGNRYYYMLDGIMKDWKENENGHLTFYNLPPREYILHIKGGNKYGEKFKGEAILFIEVVPYWWQTKWFYSLLILLAGAIIYLLVKRRIKNIRHESLLKIKIAESEMMALRAQMNPHFIFNCMNIIDGLITDNRKAEAKDFLQKFSKLIRLVLENSQQQLVPLNSDLKALKLYTEMEAIRYNHNFSYDFIVDTDIEDEIYKIPPLLLQPFVENAIVHGLRHKEDGHGKLIIAIKKEDANLIVTIQDNGVGRAKSAAINQTNNPAHQQIGMRVTSKRIELLETTGPGKIGITITDLAAGTKVVLKLPLEFTSK